jgi:CHASE2 domain-containing sensor protein
MKFKITKLSTPLLYIILLASIFQSTVYMYYQNWVTAIPYLTIIILSLIILDKE